MDKNFKVESNKKVFKKGYSVCMHTMGDGKVVYTDDRIVVVKFDSCDVDVQFIYGSALINYLMFGTHLEVFGKVKDGDPKEIKVKSVDAYKAVFLDKSLSDSGEWGIYSDYVTKDCSAAITYDKKLDAYKLSFFVWPISNMTTIPESKKTFEVVV